MCHKSGAGLDRKGSAKTAARDGHGFLDGAHARTIEQDFLCLGTGRLADSGRECFRVGLPYGRIDDRLIEGTARAGRRLIQRVAGAGKRDGNRAFTGDGLPAGKTQGGIQGIEIAVGIENSEVEQPGQDEKRKNGNEQQDQDQLDQGDAPEGEGSTGDSLPMTEKLPGLSSRDGFLGEGPLGCVGGDHFRTGCVPCRNLIHRTG